ncbi:protein translocase SEC61 complex subunit gamma [Candidatus Micrarchaeota archaeon]|nr:protein translocase SEC61 complex subunit gamma [Candidatus Micrarchaeota archaeon]
MNVKQTIKNIKQGTTSFLSNAVRVLRLTTKPKRDELWTVVKITGLGIILLGFIGYIVDSIRFLLGG